MPPEHAPFDPQRILEVLARHEVRCVVIGGYAAVLAGIDIVTRDIDITPATEPANLQRLADALNELHAAIRVPNEPPVPLPADPRLLARAEIWNLATDAGDLTSRRDRTARTATKTCNTAPIDNPSARAYTSRSPRWRTSSAARPPPVAPRTSPPFHSYMPRSGASRPQTGPPADTASSRPTRPVALTRCPPQRTHGRDRTPIGANDNVQDELLSIVGEDATVQRPEGSPTPRYRDRKGVADSRPGVSEDLCRHDRTGASCLLQRKDLVI